MYGSYQEGEADHKGIPMSGRNKEVRMFRRKRKG